jgi:hypothetical protein
MLTKTERIFRLTVFGIELTDEQLDALFDASCDDATVALERDGTVLGLFDREAQTQDDAVLSAIMNVENAAIGARALRVTEDYDWLTASEIAERTSRTRQSMSLLIRGDRGPGGLPLPVARKASSHPLSSWSEVATWFERYEPGAIGECKPRLSPDFLAELNDRLDLREQQRHSPDTPWRVRLAETFPLGA